MRLIVALLLLASAQGLVIQAEPDKAEEQKDNEEVEKPDWRNEWKNGDVPSWKETYPPAALPYEDRQSDGKPGFLQAEPEKTEEQKEDASPEFDKDAVEKDWRNEWKNGDVPSWKETYPKAALPYEDRQSDGKPSLLQAEPDTAEKQKEDASPKFDKDDVEKDWRNEWKNGDVPSWKETYPKAALPYEDRQSDGKPGFLQAEPEKTEDGPKFDNDAYKEDWHDEWKSGDMPSWKETYPKAALPYEDRQSDGEISNGLTGANVGAYLKHKPDGTIER